MKCFDETYNRMLKAEIHCHLEGSIRTATLIDIAREYGLSLPAYQVAELDRYVKVTSQMQNLQAVLDAFRIAQNSIVSPAVVERIGAELFEDANRQNIRLLEVRFSPDWAFRGHNLNWDEAFEGLQRAKDRAEKQYGMAIGWIAIASRGMGPESCAKTADWAIHWKDAICGFDLADSEADHPIGEFVQQIRRVKAAGLKVTVHSGEDTPASAVVDTIRQAEPDRIGHGIHIIEDMRAVELVKERGITLEVNPWSNYLTNSVRRIEEHPLKQLFDLGVKVTINSDDPELLDTNLNNEVRIAHEILGMRLEDIAACNRYAVEASFLPEETKQKVLAAFKQT